jgi:hypothetical protein
LLHVQQYNSCQLEPVSCVPMRLCAGG